MSARTLRVDCAKCGKSAATRYERNAMSYRVALNTMSAAASTHKRRDRCDGTAVFSVQVYPRER